MQRIEKFGCCLAVIAGIVAAATGETIDATIFRQKLLITPTAGKVTSTFANFPVLVRLSAARQPGFDPAACGVNGADIRFALEDGTLLAHDVDTWSLTGESLVWVNVPSLTASTKIVAYWGLEGGKTAPEVEHGDAWPNFIAVWHLSEESGVALDASKNRYDSTNGSSVASSSDVAVIGRSRNVKGDQFKTGVLTLANPDAKRPLTHVAKFTVSGWMRDSSSTETGYRVLITKGAWGADGWAVQTQNCRNKISGVGYNQSMRTWTFPNGKTLAGQWHYLTVSFNNGTAQSWLDGTKIENSLSSVQAPNESKTHQLVFAGGMTGYVDEMRMMDGATSDAWVAADYAAQTDADFLSYGGVAATWFAVKPIAKQVYVPGGAPCEPIPTIVDTATGAELDAKDFTFTWTDNTARGTGTVKVTAKGGSAGDQVSADFTIVNGYYVTGYALAKEGDGLSWESAMSLTNAIAVAAADDVLMLKAGVYPVAAQFTISKPLTLKGGYAGTDDVTFAADPVTTLDGQDTAESVVNATAASSEQVFSRMAFVNGKNHGLYKSGSGAILIFNCRFANNGTAVRGLSGRGAWLSGTAGTTVAVISNCVFAGNAQCSYETPDGNSSKGFAIYAEKLASLTIDDTLFLTNGAGPSAQSGYNSVARQGHFRGSAIYANAVPVTARRCQFRANRATCYESAGGCVWLEGACGGSVFDHCLWAGNYENWGWGDGGVKASTHSGALVLNLSSVNDTVTVRSSTIAYNISGLKDSASGISVAKGKLMLQDSVLYGNRISGASNKGDVGRDLALTTGNGFADVSYTLFTTSNDVMSVSSVEAGNLKFGDGVIFGNPLFVTGLDEAMSHVGNWDYKDARYNAADLADVLAFNLHLRGRSGYVDEKTGEVVRSTGRTSPAIDAGDPTSDWTNETAPNGRRVNMGFYGNTEWATMSNGGLLIIVQ